MKNLSYQRLWLREKEWMMRGVRGRWRTLLGLAKWPHIYTDWVQHAERDREPKGANCQLPVIGEGGVQGNEQVSWEAGL